MSTIRKLALGAVALALVSAGCGDDGDGGGTAYTAGTGIDIAGETISADIGTNVGQVAAGSHEHDADYVNTSGDTMTGALTLPADPTNPLEAATKQYVDSADADGHILGELIDVTLSSPAEDDILAYNAGASEWTNQTAAEAGLATSADLAGHNHDATYYTKGEVDTALAAKADIARLPAVKQSYTPNVEVLAIDPAATVATVTVDFPADGYAVVLCEACIAKIDTDQPKATLKADGTELTSTFWEPGADAAHGPVQTLSWVDQVTAGTSTYTLEVFATGSSLIVRDRKIVVMYFPAALP